MRLDDGWNQIQFNLADFTRRAYGTTYVETLRVQESIMNMSSSFFTKSTYNGIMNCLALVCRFTQTAASVESTSPIGSTRKRSCPPSSSFTSPSR